MAFGNSSGKVHAQAGPGDFEHSLCKPEKEAGFFVVITNKHHPDINCKACLRKLKKKA